MQAGLRVASGLVSAVMVASVGLVTLAMRPAAQGPSAKEIYQDKCAVCHGDDGHAKTAKGKKSKTKDIDETIGKMSEAEMIKVVHDGKDPNMDAWAKEFNDAQIKGLVQYYRSLSTKKAK